MKYLLLSLLILTSADIHAHAQSANEAADNWHQWRGPDMTGVSRTAKPPTTWSEEQNIQWKVKIDGDGSSTPIIWNDKVFLISAINTGKVDPSLPKPEDQPKRVFNITDPNTNFRFVVICLDRATGKEIWRQVANEKVPHEGTHNDNDFASASPTTDGKHLYCWFGSAGMYCFTLDGQPVWKRDLGEVKIGARLGEGCSPVIHDNKIVLVRDHSRQSTIEVLDATSGRTLWKKNRDEQNAWATPRVLRHSGKTQIVTTGSKLVRSYDLQNGDVIWQCSGLTGNCIPCPVVLGDNVLCMSGYQGYSLMSLPLSATGDISDSDKVNWKLSRGTPYVPSPVLYDDQLFFTQSNSSIMTSVDANSGDILIKQTRLPTLSNIYASPVAANGHIYFIGRNGKALVLRKSNLLDVVAKNSLNERFDASPAMAGDQLFLRGEKHLYCISASKAN